VEKWHAEVLTHERRGPDVAVFTCRPAAPLSFRPGQHVTIECPYRPWRSHPFAIANAPRPDHVLEFHARAPIAAAGSQVASDLVHRLKPGDLIRLGEPRGTLALDPYSRRDVVFVTGGTGLAPAKALIDELIRYNRTRWIHLYRGERRSLDFYDRDHVDRLAMAHPWLSVVRATSAEPDERGAQSTIAEVVSRHGPWPNHDFYVFGSPAMIASTVRRLGRMSVPPTRIHYDMANAALPAGRLPG
jgi:NAD(P)H-flavin reductase